MANTIALADKYASMIDEVYASVSKSIDLETPARVGDFVGANAVKYFKIAMDGLGDYGRNTGYSTGEVNGSWEVLTLAQDRGRSFQVDNMDNEETLNQAFGQLAGEFERTKVVPELDSYRFAKIAGTAGIGSATPATLSSATVVAAIDAAITTMDEAEVPEEGRILYLTPVVYSYLKNSTAVTRFVQSADMAIDRNIEMFDTMKVVKVPQTRFYTKIDLVAGSTAGTGGYIKNVATGKDINFMIIHPGSVIAVTKLAKPRIFDPSVNQEADAYKFDYRRYHDIFVLDNKLKGIYLHNKA